MKIAISAILFNNNRFIGAQRPRALAFELARAGHEVVVFAPRVDSDDRAAAPEGVRVVDLPPYSQPDPKSASLPLWQRAAQLLSVLPTTPRATILRSEFLSRIFGVSASDRTDLFEALNRRRFQTTHRVRAMTYAVVWARASKPTVSAAVRAEGSFDAIFATYGPWGSLLIGSYLKELCPNAVFNADLRDPMVSSEPLLSARLIMKAAERNILRRADRITTVSHGSADHIRFQKANEPHMEKVHVLPNGFVPRHRKKTSTEKGPLKIVYTGQLYGGQRDATPMFQAISAALEANPDLVFEVHYAGNQGQLMTDFARKFSLEQIVVDHGQLSHEESLALQDAADILLVLSWNRDDHLGVVSGKFGEYLGAGKPLLALVSGDRPNSELAELMTSMNVGHIFEEAGHDEISGITEFLSNAAERKQAGRPPDHFPVQEEVDKFNYANIAGTLASLLDRRRGH